MQKGKLSEIKKSPLIKSMTINTLVRPLSIIINVVYTPFLLDYLGDEKYGLWATILSIISWINFCDIGIGDGLRNLLTEELTKKDYDSAKKSISTAYIVLSLISTGLFVILLIISLLVNWKYVFNTRVEMQAVMIISFGLICLNFILGLGKSILYSLQLSENVAIINFLAVLIQFIGILIIRQFSKGNFIYISLIFGLSSTVVFLCNDIQLAKKYEYFMPTIKWFDRNRVQALFSMGILFLVLKIGGVVMTSTDNILISRLYSPSQVTPYSTVTRFYSAVESIYIAMIAPIWGRTTIAITQNDYRWIRKTIRYLNLLMIVISAGMLVLVFLFPTISRIWLGKDLNYGNHLIMTTSLCTIFEMFSMTYSNIMNGMGLLKVQVAIAIVQSIGNIPLSIILATTCGWDLIGIKAGTLFMFILGVIVYFLYLEKYGIRKGKEVLK